MLAFDLLNIVSFFLLGAVNGLVTGGVLGMSAGVSASAGGGTLVLASVAGIVGLFATSLVDMLFPKYTGRIKGGLVSQIADVDKNGKTLTTWHWGMEKGGHIIVAGIFNGLFFWGLHSLAFFQGAGFLGNALAGGLALLGYSVIVMPLMSSLKGMGK
jgi:hypothetical protein